MQEQMKRRIAAEADELECAAQRNNAGQFVGLIRKDKGDGISETLERTPAAYETENDAIKAAQSMIDAACQGNAAPQVEAPEAELVEDAEPEPEDEPDAEEAD